MKLGKKRWWLVAFVLALIILPVGFHFYQISREPRYEGRPVSYWFKHYYVSQIVSEDGYYNGTDPTEALQALGTNALPYLVREAFSTKRDTALRTNFYKLLGKLPVLWNLPEFISYKDIRDEAVEAIGKINPPASAILPLLQKALVSTNAEQHGPALEILGNVEIGKETLVPVFARALHYPDEDSQETALEFLEGIGAPAKAAVPELVEYLKHGRNTNRIHYLTAADALGNIGPDAAPAVPVLKEIFEGEAEWGLRLRLATALCRIDGRQTNALDYIARWLKWDHEPDSPAHPDDRSLTSADMYMANRGLLARYAAEQLGRIGTNAAPAIPDLIEALDGTNFFVWIEAGPALKNMGAPKELYLPKLEEKLKLANDGPRASLALSIMKIEPGDPVAQAALIQLIWKGSPYGRVALDFWCETDRAPREAIPILQEALKSGNASWRQVAATALKQIEAQEKGK